MLKKQEFKFAQKAVRKGLVSGEQMLECIEILRSDINNTSLMDLLVTKKLLTRKAVRTIERELHEPTALVEPQTGRILQKVGCYELLQQLGEGAMGAVYKARNTANNCIVALKILDAELAHDQEFITRFLREARNAAKLKKHENIVEAYDFGEAQGKYYFAMEFVDGLCLAEIIHNRGKLEEKAALQISKQVARALAHAHSFSIIHRDIKPENIIIASSGVVKLCDLGLAKDLSQDFFKTGGITLGTAYYCSPEQATGAKQLDIRSDIYSLGISLYYMLCGELPFADSNIKHVTKRHISEALPDIRHKVPQISQATIELIHKMTEKKVSERYQAPQDVLDDIESILKGKSNSLPKKDSGNEEPEQVQPLPLLKKRKSTSTTGKILQSLLDSDVLSLMEAPRRSSIVYLVLICMAIIFMLAITFLLYLREP